jgi:predicted NUDIX family phosphoesterase
MLQLVAYGLVHDVSVQFIPRGLIYPRGDESERRLDGLWSCGIGGHVAVGETFEEAMVRELEEETGITESVIHFLGTIREIASPVGRVHLGLAFSIQVGDGSDSRIGHMEPMSSLLFGRKFEEWSHQLKYLFDHREVV